MVPDDSGELIAQFQADAGTERSLARLRTTAALLAAVGSILVMFGEVPVAVFLVALLGLLVSLAWLAQARAAGRRATRAPCYRLVVYARGFLLAEGERQNWVTFQDVTGVEVDEERLDIVVSREGAPPLRIEPRYPGVEIHALMHTLRDAFRKSCPP